MSMLVVSDDWTVFDRFAQASSDIDLAAVFPHAAAARRPMLSSLFRIKILPLSPRSTPAKNTIKIGGMSAELLSPTAPATRHRLASSSNSGTLILIHATTAQEAISLLPLDATTAQSRLPDTTYCVVLPSALELDGFMLALPHPHQCPGWLDVFLADKVLGHEAAVIQAMLLKHALVESGFLHD